MAVSNATLWSVQTIKADAVDGLQVAEVLFTVPSSNTYAQADNGILTGVAALIQNSRRNGKTVTPVGVMLSQRASKQSNPAQYLSLKTVAIATADITFEITDNDPSTELGAGAVPDQSRPFGIFVAFTES